MPQHKPGIVMAMGTSIHSLLFVSIILPLVTADPIVVNDSMIVHSFNYIDYNWPSDSERIEAITSGRYILTNNIISGLNIYKDYIFVTVPRWRLGVPSTLNRVIKNMEGNSTLEPFPSWEMNRVGDCNALQFVQSIEIDPNTGEMWIIDTGRINFLAADNTLPINKCPPKIIIYDIDRMTEVMRHVFPPDVARPTRAFLNDLVVQYHRGKPRYAFITDDMDSRLIVFDRKNNESFYHFHSNSMLPEAGSDNITILGETLRINDSINGIALSADMKYLYYAPLTSKSIWQVPTKMVRKRSRGSFQSRRKFRNSVRRVGSKPSQASGMAYSKNDFLYFPALTENTIYRWDIKTDIKGQNRKINEVKMKNISEFITPDPILNFIDILKLDQSCNLWFTVNRLHKFVLGTMDFSGKSGPNVLIMRVPTDSTGYLDRRKRSARRCRKEKHSKYGHGDDDGGHGHGGHGHGGRGHGDD